MKKNGLKRGLTIAVVGCLAFLAIRMLAYSSWDFWYLSWNLLLAGLPLGFAWLLTKNLKEQVWSGTQNILLSILWLVFLPNSFYIATDFIHIVETRETSLLFDILLFLSFTMTGLLMGYVSVVLVHRQLRSRIRTETADLAIGSIFLLCSFAVYLGRYLRWNTWDIITNPAGLLFSVSDSIVHPRAYGQTVPTTLMFFIFLSITYIVVVQFVDLNTEARRIIPVESLTQLRSSASRKKTSKQVR